MSSQAVMAQILSRLQMRQLKPIAQLKVLKNRQQGTTLAQMMQKLR